MKNLVAFLILLFIASWGYAQIKNDITFYSKKGGNYVIKNASVKAKDGKAYVTKEDGTISIYNMSLLDSISAGTDADILYSDNENESDELFANDAPITPLDDEIIEIKKISIILEMREVVATSYKLLVLV